MKVDVSEIKSLRSCERKHQFSSRNKFHLVPTVPNPNLFLGTVFHECLHSMYMGTSVGNILKYIENNVKDSVQYAVLTNMIKKYYEGPFADDMIRYTVVDIERSFQYPLYISEDTGEVVEVCGSIDMLVIDNDTKMLVGFEHKTAKNFRPDIYDLVDEQPRVYFWAMQQILKEWHKQGQHLDIIGVDCVMINQVKKLQRGFDYKRVECRYPEEDIANFFTGFIRDAQRIQRPEDLVTVPQPDFMKCQMCDYVSLCMHYGYKKVDMDDLLEEFEGEYKVREQDHLEDKTVRIVTGDEVAQQDNGEAESKPASKRVIDFSKGTISNG